MLNRLRHRSPSHATVVAYLALFVALGGTTAYAADTVFSSDIKDGEVKNADLAFDAVSSSKIRDNAIQGSDINDFTITANDFNVNTIGSSKVLDDSLTGNDVLETSLNPLQFGKVREAIAADSVDGGSLCRTDGVLVMSPGAQLGHVVETICTAGPLRLTARCRETSGGGGPRVTDAILAVESSEAGWFFGTDAAGTFLPSPNTAQLLFSTNALEGGGSVAGSTETFHAAAARGSQILGTAGATASYPAGDPEGGQCRFVVGAIT